MGALQGRALSQLRTLDGIKFEMKINQDRVNFYPLFAEERISFSSLNFQRKGRPLTIHFLICPYIHAQATSTTVFARKGDPNATVLPFERCVVFLPTNDILYLTQLYQPNFVLLLISSGNDRESLGLGNTEYND